MTTAQKIDARNLTPHQREAEEAAGMPLDWGSAGAFALGSQQRNAELEAQVAELRRLAYKAREEADIGSPEKAVTLLDLALANTKASPLYEAAPEMLEKLVAVTTARDKWRSQDDSEAIDSITYMDMLDALDIDSMIARATLTSKEG